MRRACTLLRGNNGTTIGYGLFLSCPQCGQNMMLVEEPDDVFEKTGWFNEHGRFEMWCPNHNENLESPAPGGGRFQAHRLPAGIMSRAIPTRRGTPRPVTVRGKATIYLGGGR